MCRAFLGALRVVAIVLVVAVAGCAVPLGAAPEPTDPLTARPTTDPTDGSAPLAGGDATPRPEPTDFGQPSAEPTAVVTTRRDDGGTITVPGPTVDNRYQEDFTDFSRIPDHCAFLVNESREDGLPASPLAVRVLDLRIARQTPQGSTAFRYYDPDPGVVEGGCLNGLVDRVVYPCRGAVLPPVGLSTEGGVGCPTGIAFSGSPGTDHTAEFVVTLEVECTSREVRPCDKIEGREPTAAAPTRVRWDSVTDLRACLGRMGGPGHAESRGLCPHDEETTGETTGERTEEPAGAEPTS
jgi:hypothetical protein